MNNYEEKIPLLLAFLGVVVLIHILCFTLKWCVGDAKKRGTSISLVVVAVILFFPFGLIGWLWFRPEPVMSQHESFKLEDHQKQ